MPRYHTRPSARVRSFYVGDFGPDETVPEVQVAEHVAADTGLLDANGEIIWRDPRPIGFGRDEEW